MITICYRVFNSDSQSILGKSVKFLKGLIDYNLVCIFRNDYIESQKNSRCLGGGTGRRKGLKIPRAYACTSSILVPGTSSMKGIQPIWLDSFFYLAYDYVQGLYKDVL